jgi:hypothetical protein
MEKPCNCGKTNTVFHPDENQYEPECWQCYYKEYENLCKEFGHTEEELPF